MVYPQAIVARANSLKNSGVPDDIFKLDDLSVLVSGYLPPGPCASPTIQCPPTTLDPGAMVILFYRHRHLKFIEGGALSKVAYGVRSLT